MPRRQIPILILSILATSIAFAQDSTSTDEQSQTVTLTISEFQTEIERACAADAKQARQFRAQRELSDRLSDSLAQCRGALGLATENDTRERLGEMTQLRRDDSLWYIVGAGLAAASGGLAIASFDCGEPEAKCLGFGFASLSAAAVSTLIWIWRF